MMHCRTRAAGMTWNAYYRDKMNRAIGIRPIRIDADANFVRDIFSRSARSAYDRNSAALSGKNRA